MSDKQRIVVDTNVLVCRLLLPDSVPGRAVRHIIDAAVVMTSDETLGELADVLSRSKFDRYITVAERQHFLQLWSRVAQRVEIITPVQASRDPHDDKFLALAVNGEAGVIVSGDPDLLVLDPYHGVNIITPARYLQAIASATKPCPKTAERTP